MFNETWTLKDQIFEMINHVYVSPELPSAIFIAEPIYVQIFYL
jgi:hypothetical protein